jgi:calcineurin-like phosphoesterase family protein
MLPGIYDAFQRWGEQTVWIYSDPHFSDEDLECGIKNRPSDEEQIRRINAKAGRKDTLIILGDVGNIECVRKLRAGRKVLICGNHDVGASTYKRVVHEPVEFDKRDYSVEEAISETEKIHPDCIYQAKTVYSHDGLFEWWSVTADNGLFDEVYEGPLMIGEKLLLSHEPVDVPWAFNIHGHDHKGEKREGHLNVCADVIGYKPIHMNNLLAKTGILSKTESIHRQTIDKATKRKQKRGGKKIGQK